MPGRAGPVLIAYDGSPASEHALRAAGELLAPRPAVVLVVHQEGIAWELVELPPSSIGLPPASIDVGTALETEEAMRERAQRLARKGAALARDAGFDAEGLVVADEVDMSVAETIVKVARERDAQPIVIGAHRHGRLAEAVLGSTSRDVIRRAPCPVLVTRHSETAER